MVSTQLVVGGRSLTIGSSPALTKQQLGRREASVVGSYLTTTTSAGGGGSGSTPQRRRSQSIVELWLFGGRYTRPSGMGGGAWTSGKSL